MQGLTVDDSQERNIGALAVVYWKDLLPRGSMHRYFSFGQEVRDSNDDVIMDSYGVNDTKIFYYCEGEEEFLRMCAHSEEDFVITEYEMITSVD